jgi:hypothetical protein
MTCIVSGAVRMILSQRLRVLAPGKMLDQRHAPPRLPAEPRDLPRLLVRTSFLT